jgi:hypothetical protein
MNDTLDWLHQQLQLLDPALYIRLQEKRQVTEYLILSLLVPNPEEALRSSLSPSKYDYLDSVLEEEYEDAWLQFSKNGILTYELINLVAECEPDFTTFNFPDNEDSRMLRYAIIGTIAQYLQTK